MIIRKAFKFQLKTKPLQEAKMKRFAGCCRKVWNLGLELQKKRLDNKEYCLNYSKLATELKNWKNDPKLQFLNEAHSQILQQTLMNLDRAIEVFKKVTRTDKQIFLTMISATGLKKTNYMKEMVGGIVMLDDLFEKDE